MMLDMFNNMLDECNGRTWVMKMIGVSICLIGAALMYHGKLLGANTTGYATVIGIFGIGIISGSRRR